MATLLKMERQARGLSMREVALDAGIPLSTVSKLERGTLNNPTLSTMKRLGEVYEIEPQEWFNLLSHDL